ncbi:MAG: DNA gyrase subunit B [Planctomycetota bacterium]
MPDVARYDESRVQVLEGTEHVRKRPAMYIGDTALRGLHHLVYEVVDNSIDEAMAGFCQNITVVVKADGSIGIEDDGRGFPVGIKEGYNMSAVELCLTKLGAGAKFDHDSYKVSGGLHGVGVSVVNALSETMEVQVCRDGQVWVIGFERGKTTRPLSAVGVTEKTGTRVDFKPDTTIFRECDFHYDILAKRLRELAYLNRGLNITITDERDDKEETFCFEHGLRQFVQHLNEGKQSLHAPITFVREDREQRLICEVALQYTDGYTETSLSFANNINTVEGGTHLSGFRSALTRTINNYARKGNLLKANAPTPQGDDIREGLTVVLSVKVPEPQFEGQTKTKLGNGEVGTFVETAVGEMLGNYLEEHPAEAKRVVAKATQAALAREAARKARETARKSAFSGSGFSRKLIDCSSRDVGSTELYIVEGDSAAGSAKGYRDARTQAILPIGGKILNVEKARLHKVLGHQEIVEIIRALGTGIGSEDFDISKLRYGRIILMTDADVDGSHIRTLLLTFFFRHLRPLVDRGVIYIAQPPLYQIAKGKQAKYVLDDAELNAHLTRLGLESVELVINRPRQETRCMPTERLRELLMLIEDLERQSKILSRRGIPLRQFIDRLDANGCLPIIRAQADGDESYFHDEDEFEKYRRAQLAHGRSVVKNELTEARPLRRCLEKLTDFDCSAEDLFMRREEQITGDLTPAVFVLRSTAGDPLELHNLLELPGGVRSVGARGREIKRFKGLGEMNKDELWETTMNPANRVMRRVIVGQTDDDPEQSDIDAVEADRIFSILMGEDVALRKEFIEENAIHVKNLDI